MTLSELFLSLFILNLAVAFGAGLYETRIVLPLWFSKTSTGFQVNVSAMQEIETGRRFWGFVTTMPLTLLTIVNIVMAVQSSPPLQTWWLTSALITLVERIGTFTFFIPTAIKLAYADKMPASSVSAKVAMWIRLNYVRSILTLLACFTALHALTLLS